MIDLTSLGPVVVHPKREWPDLWPASPRPVKCEGALHTTQRNVHEAVVARKIADIRRGQVLRASVVVLHGKTWVFDGHHTIAAYFKLGQTPRCWLYANTGPDMVEAPKLR